MCTYTEVKIRTETTRKGTRKKGFRIEKEDFKMKGTNTRHSEKLIYL